MATRATTWVSLDKVILRGGSPPGLLVRLDSEPGFYFGVKQFPKGHPIGRTLVLVEGVGELDYSPSAVYIKLEQLDERGDLHKKKAGAAAVVTLSFQGIYIIGSVITV